VKLDRPGQKGKSQSQAPGRKIQFSPMPNLNKGPVRR
jgi:hypothetical protein